MVNLGVSISSITISDEIGCVRSMNLPDWVSSSNLGTVSNNDSNTGFPQQKPKQPHFPHAFLPEHCATTQRMLAAARTHSLPSHHHPPPPTTLSHRCSLTSPPQAPTPRTHSSLATPRYATAHPRPPPRDCSHTTTTTAAAACRSSTHAVLCCVWRKRPPLTRRYRPGAAVLLAARRRLCPAHRTSGV